MNTSNQIEIFKQRDFGELINITFAFVRQNAKPLLRAQFFINGPLLLVCILLLGAAQYFTITQISNTPANLESMNQLNLGFSGFLNVLFLIGVIVYLIMVSLVPLAYIKLYQNKTTDFKDKIEPAAVWKIIKTYFAKGFGAAVLVYIMIVVGMFLCVAPGIWLAISFSVFMPVLVLENASAIDSIKRSFALVKEHWWETFGFILVIAIILSVLMGLVYIPVYIVMGVTVFHELSANPQGGVGFFQNNLIWFVVSLYGMSLLVSLISTTIQQIAFAFKYGQLVEVKEGKGLLSEIDTIVDGSENETL